MKRFCATRSTQSAPSSPQTFNTADV
jgi:hypothetical protein